MKDKQIWGIVGIAAVIYLIAAYAKKWFPFNTMNNSGSTTNPTTGARFADVDGDSTYTYSGETSCTVYDAYGNRKVITGNSADPNFRLLCEQSRSQTYAPIYWYGYPYYTPYWYNRVFVVRGGRRHGGGHHGGGMNGGTNGGSGGTNGGSGGTM